MKRTLQEQQRAANSQTCGTDTRTLAIQAINAFHAEAQYEDTTTAALQAIYNREFLPVILRHRARYTFTLESIFETDPSIHGDRFRSMMARLNVGKEQRLTRRKKARGTVSKKQDKREEEDPGAGGAGGSAYGGHASGSGSTAVKA